MQVVDYLFLIIVCQHVKMVTSFLKNNNYNLFESILAFLPTFFNLKRLNSFLRTH